MTPATPPIGVVSREWPGEPSRTSRRGRRRHPAPTSCRAARRRKPSWRTPRTAQLPTPAGRSGSLQRARLRRLIHFRPSTHFMGGARNRLDPTYVFPSALTSLRPTEFSAGVFFRFWREIEATPVILSALAHAPHPAVVIERDRYARWPSDYRLHPG